ncbi:MAG: hypothetical protein R3270_02620 [Gammaproteobacteria bacterium]|nr:hypothetical protein [Gammaproteobacteria bacterium]
MARQPTALDRRLVGTRSLFHYLPALLLYPFRLHPLLAVLVLGSFLWAFSASLFGLLFVVMAATGLMQYSLRVLERSATGHGDPPPLGSDEMLYFDARLLKLLFVLFVAGGMVTALDVISPAIGWATRIVFWLVFPAFMLLLALSDSLAFSISPQRLLRISLLSGPLYPALVMLLAVGFGYGMAPIGTLYEQGINPEALVFNMPDANRWLAIVAAAFSSILFAHLLGFVAYHHRETIGLEVEVTQEDIDRADGVDAATRRRQLLARLDQHLRKHDAALALQELRHAARDLDHQEQLELLDDLATNNLWPLVRDQGERCIRAQLAARHGELAAITALRMLLHFSAFHTQRAADWLAVCEAAARHRPDDGFEKLALQGLERFPQASERVDIALLLARHYAERHGNDAEAIRILEDIEHVGEHPRAQQVERLLAVLRGR